MQGVAEVPVAEVMCQQEAGHRGEVFVRILLARVGGRGKRHHDGSVGEEPWWRAGCVDDTQAHG